MGNPKTGIFTNSEDPDEMPHNAAFHQGLHVLFGKKDLQTKNAIFFFKSYSLTTLDIYTMDHPQVYSNICTKPEGGIHYYIKG